MAGHKTRPGVGCGQALLAQAQGLALAPVLEQTLQLVQAQVQGPKLALSPVR